MTMNIMKTPVFRVAYRGLSAQAAVKHNTEVAGSPEINCTILPSKTVVSSQDLFGALARVSFIFRAGPRNETEKNRGVSHMIRFAVGFSTAHYTGFWILRNLQQTGAYLSCTGDRETTAFNLITTRDNVHNVLKYLASVSTAPAFKPWELSDNIPRLKYQIATLSPETRTLDILHKAAYRTGLGYSLFIKKDHIGSINSEDVSRFFSQGFTANRASVVGYNVNHSELVNFVQNVPMDTGDLPNGNSSYFGGEIRKDKNSQLAVVAVATEGVGLKNLKEALTFSVLQHAIGVSPSVIWGSSPSPLQKAVSAASVDAGATCLNISYSDTGLFGFIISSSGHTAGRAVEAAFKVLKAGSVTDSDVARGKAQVKSRLLTASENSEKLLEDIGTQALLNGAVVPGPVLAEAIDKISTSDVCAAARKVASGKLSLAGFGNLNHVPYLDQLK